LCLVPPVLFLFLFINRLFQPFSSFQLQRILLEAFPHAGGPQFETWSTLIFLFTPGRAQFCPDASYVFELVSSRLALGVCSFFVTGEYCEREGRHNTAIPPTYKCRSMAKHLKHAYFNTTDFAACTQILQILQILQDTADTADTADTGGCRLRYTTAGAAPHSLGGTAAKSRICTARGIAIGQQRRKTTAHEGKNTHSLTHSVVKCAGRCMLTSHSHSHSV